MVGRLSAAQAQHLLVGARAQPWTGQAPVGRPVVCSAITEPGRRTSVNVTFDVGYHASGWWANSDYDQCYHLSITHPGEGSEVVMMPETREFVTRRKLETPSDDEVRAWALHFFGGNARHAWIEPAASPGDPHRLPNVVHVRVFVDPRTGEPFSPVGEVYHLKPLEGLTPPKIAEGRAGADVR